MRVFNVEKQEHHKLVWAITEKLQRDVPVFFLILPVDPLTERWRVSLLELRIIDKRPITFFGNF